MRLMAAIALLWLGCGVAQARVQPAYGYGHGSPSSRPVMDLSLWLAPSAGPAFAAPAPQSPPEEAVSDVTLTKYSLPKDAPPLMAQDVIAPETSVAPRFSVQVGAFSLRENAERLLEQALQAGEARIDETQAGVRLLHQVRIGDYATRLGAERALQQALDAGLAGVIVAIRP